MYILVFIYSGLVKEKLVYLSKNDVYHFIGNNKNHFCKALQYHLILLEKKRKPIVQGKMVHVHYMKLIFSEICYLEICLEIKC